MQHLCSPHTISISIYAVMKHSVKFFLVDTYMYFWFWVLNERFMSKRGTVDAVHQMTYRVCKKNHEVLVNRKISVKWHVNYLFNWFIINHFLQLLNVFRDVNGIEAALMLYRTINVWFCSQSIKQEK